MGRSGLTDQALTVFNEVGDARYKGILLWNISIVLGNLGDRTRAIASAAAVCELLEKAEDPDAKKVREQLAQWREK